MPLMDAVAAGNAAKDAEFNSGEPKQAPPSKDENVVDAEFTEVKDSK
jgi:hypothetical protein